VARPWLRLSCDEDLLSGSPPATAQVLELPPGRTTPHRRLPNDQKTARLHARAARSGAFFDWPAWLRRRQAPRRRSRTTELRQAEYRAFCRLTAESKIARLVAPAPV